MRTLFRSKHPVRICLLIALITTFPSIAASKPGINHYRLTFAIDLTRTDGSALARISVKQAAHLLREVRFRAPAERYTGFHGDGAIERDGAFVTWKPPAQGGSINYLVLINHQRAGGGFDALVAGQWALFRGDNVFPPATIRQRVGARAVSELSARLPDDWTLVTPFTRNADGRLLIDNPHRIFDRPVGWIIAGRLGVRRDNIADIKISVAGPHDAGIQRIGMLAMLRWTLPLLAAEIDSPPARISIVSAGEPMWHGGLSAPNSLFIHADRPLLSENATSTLLHEMIHVLMPVPALDEQDWIDEGIAEYVTLKVLRRSGTISQSRFLASLATFARRGQRVGDLSTVCATGAVTARAVTIFHAVDDELQTKTGGRVDIFELIRHLMRRNEATGLTDLRALTTKLTGGIPLKALDNRHVPGFDSP